MAQINVSPRPTQDPEWLRQQSPSRPPTDTTLGSLFEGIGKVADAGVKGVYSAINENIKEDAFKVLDPIRAAHGGELSPEEVKAIAGKGSRGAKWEASGGATDDLGMDNVPPDVVQTTEGLRRMKAARDAGELSNSHYMASLEAAVKQLRTQYPGFREEVDAAVSKITGVTPANALRSSILSDMNSMAAAAGSLDKRLDTRYHSDNEYIQTIYPGMTAEQYKQNYQSIDVAVGRLKARDYQIKSNGASLEFMDKNDKRTSSVAEQTFANRANFLVSNFMTGTMSKLRTEAEMLRAKGTDAKPEEIAALQTRKEIAESQLRSLLDQESRRPLSEGSSNNFRTYVKPETINARIDEAVAPLQTITTLLGTKDSVGLAHTAALMTKYRGDVALNTLERIVPSVTIMKAVNQSIGPQGAAVVLPRTNALPELTQAINGYVAYGIAAKNSGLPPPTISQALAAHSDGNPDIPVPPKIANMTVDQFLHLVNHPDPEIAGRAVQGLYADPKFFAGVKPDDKLKIYTKLGSSDVTQKISRLGDQAWQQYSTWMKENFVPVAKQGIDDLNSNLEFNRVNVKFRPDTMQFSIIPKPGFEGDRNVFGSEITNRRAEKINQSLRLIAPVLKKEYGADAPAELLQLLQNSGVKFGAEQKGTFAEELGKAVAKGLGDKFNEWFEAGPRSVPVKPDERLLGVDIRDIPEGMSARDFLKQFQKK